jgi:hypothetical protein
MLDNHQKAGGQTSKIQQCEGLRMGALKGAVEGICWVSIARGSAGTTA